MFSYRSAGLGLFLVTALVGVLLFGGSRLVSRTNPVALARTPLPAAPVALQVSDEGDPFQGGVAWINVSGPIKLKDLKGKVVLVDFWTYCCINCMHILPDLEKLEEKYKNELVVIGVHSPKFPAEQNTKNIRDKVAEYHIHHPVVNDADQMIWNTFGANSWPTLVLIDTQGKPVGRISGEGHLEILDRAIRQVIDAARKAGTLDETPVKFFPEVEKVDDTPLLYPGKVVADPAGQRLFIADTGHNRIVIASLEGKPSVTIGDGRAGLVDGDFTKARFHRPQGMALVKNILYVADTENHAIRSIDLEKNMVATVAGNGQQSHAHVKPGESGHLNSPWDLIQLPSRPDDLFIAMAGPHQIWKLNLETKKPTAFAGNGREDILDGPVANANFAQPSGLATDGTHLYVADSEVSAVRQLQFHSEGNRVKTIVGSGLFDYGDEDGTGPSVRLQHCLGVAFGDGKLYIADTFNNKIKVCDPAKREVHTFVGDGKAGSGDNPAEFNHPGGISLDGKTLYVADTNNHLIRAVDVATKTVSTLKFPGLTMPKPRRAKPSFPNANVETLASVSVAPSSELTVDVTVPVPSGFKLNGGGAAPYAVESPDIPGLIEPEFLASGGRVERLEKTVSLKVPLAKATTAGDAFTLKVSLQAFVCSEGSNFCTIKNYTWNVPVKVTDGAATTISIPAAH
jgi:thiol-disulfide isomerase/thioredoxin